MREQEESFLYRHFGAIIVVVFIGMVAGILIHVVFFALPAIKAENVKLDAKAKPYCDKIEFYSVHTAQCERLGVRP